MTPVSTSVFDVQPSCYENSLKFYNFCLPIDHSLSTLERIKAHASDGLCIELITRMFFSCMPNLEVLRWEGVCFKSYEDLGMCLPGANAYLSHDPENCRIASFVIFLMNEGMFLHKGDWKITLIWAAAVKGLRYLETQHCLPSCRNASDTFTFVGPREMELEFSRYKRAAFNYLIENVEDPLSFVPYGRTIKSVAKTVYGGIKSCYDYVQGSNKAADVPLNFLATLALDLIPGISQQGLRNRDFHDVYANCLSAKEYYRRYVAENFKLATLPKKACRAIWKYVLSPLFRAAQDAVLITTDSAKNLLLIGLQNFWSSVQFYGRKARLAIYNNLFAKDQLLQFLVEFAINALDSTILSIKACVSICLWMKEQLELGRDLTQEKWTEFSKWVSEVSGPYLNQSLSYWNAFREQLFKVENPYKNPESESSKEKQSKSNLREIFSTFSNFTTQIITEASHNATGSSKEGLEKTKGKVNGLFKKVSDVIFGPEPDTRYSLS